MENSNHKEEKTHYIETNNEVPDRDGKNIENEKDVHEIESGNVAEADAQKDLLSGPANDLTSSAKKEGEN